MSMLVLGVDLKPTAYPAMARLLREEERPESERLPFPEPLPVRRLDCSVAGPSWRSPSSSGEISPCCSAKQYSSQTSMPMLGFS